MPAASQSAVGSDSTGVSSAAPAGPTLCLILGDQLNPLHSWFARPDPQRVHVLLELRQETDYVVHHAQKVIAIFAAMRDFARQLKAAGHRVRHVAIDDASNPTNGGSMPTASQRVGACSTRCCRSRSTSRC